MRIKHYALVEKGKLILSNKDQFLTELKRFEGKKIYVVLDEERPTRSNEQLRYYFGVVLSLISEFIDETTGKKYTSEDLHEYYIEKGYFGETAKEINGEIIVMKNRSAKTNTLQFSEAVEKIKREWAEKGLYIPDANEVTTTK